MAKPTPQQNTNRRRAARRKRQIEAQTSGCCGLIVLALLLSFLSLALLPSDEPITAPWTSSLDQNPYGPEDFIQLGGYLTCLAGDTRRGIDVSEYQETVDWEAVKAAGFDFAFVRIGYRGYTTGDIYADDRAWENLEGARAAGLDVGVYFYAQAIDTAEARQEAKWCLEFLDGHELQLPVVYDWEWVSSNARTGQMDKATLTECAHIFCETIRLGGYEPMVYFNPHVANDLLDLEQLDDYPFWLAMYNTKMDFPYQVDFWQYTEEGSVPGIDGDVDINLMFLYD